MDQLPLVIIDDKLHANVHPFLLGSKCQLCGRESSKTCCDIYLSHLTDEYLEKAFINYTKYVNRLKNELEHRKSMQTAVEQWF
jgi:hypothetical protein